MTLCQYFCHLIDLGLQDFIPKSAQWVLHYTVKACFLVLSTGTAVYDPSKAELTIDGAWC
jgi:hypothetical protein